MFQEPKKVQNLLKYWHRLCCEKDFQKKIVSGAEKAQNLLKYHFERTSGKKNLEVNGETIYDSKKALLIIKSRKSLAC